MNFSSGVKDRAPILEGMREYFLFSQKTDLFKWLLWPQLLYCFNETTKGRVSQWDAEWILPM